MAQAPSVTQRLIVASHFCLTKQIMDEQESSTGSSKRDSESVFGTNGHMR